MYHNLKEKRRIRSVMKSHTSSVIICTRNRLQDLIVCLQSLQNQMVPADELIIVDSSTQPLNHNQTFQELFSQELFPTTKLKYIHTAPGLTYQRNQGIQHAQGDLIYFFDDDVKLTPEYLKNMNRVFATRPEYAGGMGTVTNPGEYKSKLSAPFRKFFLLQRNDASGKFTASGMPTHTYGLSRFTNVEVLGGCCMAFRSSVFKEELFDEKLRLYGYMEDCDFSWRVAQKAPLFYNPYAQLEHYNSPLNRDAIVRNKAMYVANYSYLFFKNIYPKNKLKFFPYLWSLFGLLCEACILTVAHKTGDYLKGYFKGIAATIKSQGKQPLT